MRRFIACALAAMLLVGIPAPAFARDAGQDTRTDAVVVAKPHVDVGSTYVVDGAAYKVKSNSPRAVALVKPRAAKNVTVPGAVMIGGKEYKVTEVGPKAFASVKKKLTSVKIGANVKVIGASAFAECVKLKKVTGGAAVRAVKAKAFKGCAAMTKCAPLASKRLGKLGASALEGCKAIKAVTLGGAVTQVGKSAFSGCAKLGAVKGGAAVRTVGANAFKGCAAMAKCAPLSSKKLGKIGTCALSGAKKIKTLTLRTKELTKKGAKGSLKGSRVATVKVDLGNAKANKAYVAKYKKIFTEAICGKKVKVE